jgi:hypothetical protein
MLTLDEAGAFFAELLCLLRVLGIKQPDFGQLVKVDALRRCDGLEVHVLAGFSGNRGSIN